MRHGLLPLFAHILLTVFVVGCSSVESPPPPTFAGAAREAPSADETVEAEAVIAVEGMVCQGCANAAAEAATQVPGCVSARGVFEDGTVVVRYLPDRTTPEAIAAAITGADRGDAPAFRARLASP